MSPTPLIIGHRGACGYLPEHTLESYQRAIDLGADAVETDVVITGDGHLICRHDCELSVTTDVARRAEFASRKTIKTIDGVKGEGWFVEDFTLDEIRTLRARQRFDFRDRSFDDQFAVATLDELLDLAARSHTTAGRRPIVVVEIKHAAYFGSLGLAIDRAVSRVLGKFQLTGPDAPAWVESFEIDVLRQLRRTIATPMIQLLDRRDTRPADVAAAGGSLTYGQMITPAGLAEIATYAFAIGPWKSLIVPCLTGSGTDSAPADRAPGRLGVATALVADAHAAGLAVQAWTFRNESHFLADDYAGDPLREYAQFAALGVDGFITDFPDTPHGARKSSRY